MKYLTFALAKGRLAEQTMDLFEKINMPCEEMKQKTRKLIFVNEELKLKFFLAKASDVPTYVEYGAADVGIVGKDTILEEERNLYERFEFRKMRYCRCRKARKQRNDKNNESYTCCYKISPYSKRLF